MFLAAAFIGNSIALAILMGAGTQDQSDLDQAVDTPVIEVEEPDQVPTDG